MVFHRIAAALVAAGLGALCWFAGLEALFGALFWSAGMQLMAALYVALAAIALVAYGISARSHTALVLMIVPAHALATFKALLQTPAALATMSPDVFLAGAAWPWAFSLATLVGLGLCAGSLRAGLGAFAFTLAALVPLLLQQAHWPAQGELPRAVETRR